MLRLKRRQREVILDTLPDLANLIAGALLFAQFVGSERFSFGVALLGMVLWVALSGCAIWLAGVDR